MFFKTISKQEHEVRSDFHAVAGDPSLFEASQLLLAPSVIRLVPAGADGPAR